MEKVSPWYAGVWKNNLILTLCAWIINGSMKYCLLYLFSHSVFSSDGMNLTIISSSSSTYYGTSSLTVTMLITTSSSSLIASFSPCLSCCCIKSQPTLPLEMIYFIAHTQNISLPFMYEVHLMLHKLGISLQEFYVLHFISMKRFGDISSCSLESILVKV